MIVGELNELSRPEEQSFRNKGNSTKYNNFNNFIQEHNFIDLGLRGNPYIWYNRREKCAAVFSRLNRALTNHFWIKTLRDQV